MPARPVNVTVPAKINLVLHSAPTARADGYHELFTVFMAVNLTDKLTLTPTDNGQITVHVTGRDAGLVPVDGTDLAVRAASLLRARWGQANLGAQISIDKSIPVGGGMAGGSADAAAALRGCNQLWGLDTNDATLASLGAQLGADVPFALLGGVAHGTNRGDVLSRLPAAGTYHWVLALASHGLSTAAVFRHFDAMNTTTTSTHPPQDGLLDALAAGDLAAVGQLLYNDLEAPACQLRPELAETLAFGRALDGVAGAVMAGSGTTCAFLTQTTDTARQVRDALATLPQVDAALIASGPVMGAQVV